MSEHKELAKRLEGLVVDDPGHGKGLRMSIDVTDVEEAAAAIRKLEAENKRLGDWAGERNAAAIERQGRAAMRLVKIKKLEAERDEARAECDAARALLKEAGEALEPFERSDWPERSASEMSGLRATFGDIRRARTLITKIKEATDGR